jgi:hypothetical protein
MSSALNGRGKEKVGFRFEQANTARARAAYLHTAREEGHASFSEFIEAAVMRETARVERKYHGGRPWPPEGAGQAPVGRPRKRQAGTGR